MRSSPVKKGAQEARRVLSAAFGLIRANLLATLFLSLLLAFLPGLVKAYLTCGAQAPLLSLWESYIAVGVSGASESLTAMLFTTMQQMGMTGLASSAVDLFASLVLTPLLLSSLALLYNGYVAAGGKNAGLQAVRQAGRNVKSLVIVALMCMLAAWFVEMVPSIASGLFSAVAGLLSFIPLIGPVASVLAVILSVLVSLLTDFAVTVVFCYIWICASCEGVTGFGALVRSWQLTRNAMRETVSALLALVALKWAAVLLCCLLWLFVGRGLSVSLSALVYCIYLLSAAHTAMLGPVSSALYQRRPFGFSTNGGPSFPGGPDLSRMKRANVNDE